MIRAARVDSNQKEIVTALRKMGAYVMLLHQVKNLFDILVAYKGNLYCIELKEGLKPESQRKLTPGEIKCKTNLELRGVKYFVVNSVSEAVELVG